MTRRGYAAVAAATLAAAPLAVWLVLATHHPAAPKLALATFGLVIGVSFIASGVVARSRRPDNATGLLMIAVGFAWFLSAVAEANNPALFTAGSIVGAVCFGFLIHLVVAFPSGRLESTFARVVVATGYTIVLGVNVTSALFSDQRSSCGTNCPRNLALVYHDEQLARALMTVFAAAALVLIVAIVVLLVRRWRRATVPMRRALLPVFLAGGATMGASTIDFATTSIYGSESATYWLLLSVFASVPGAFLFGLLRSRLAGSAVAHVLAPHNGGGGPHENELRLREALGDPGLELGYWYPDRSEFVDAAGAPLQTAGRHLTEIPDETGGALAVVAHDVALLEEPHRLSSVLAAARVGLQRDRLQAELRARVADLVRERDFFSTVANAIPTLLVSVEADGRVHAKGGNRAFTESTGFSDEAAVGRFLRELIGANGDLDAGIAEAVARGGSSDERESTWRARDGAEFTVLWSCTPLPHAEDESPLYAVSAMDISARKAAETQLKRSRSRLVAAAGAERRRLERNLHDGAQQRLVSVALTLRLAQVKLASEPASVGAMLGDASSELTLALEELRELARGLHPAVLSERGLEAAVRALAERSPFTVDVRVDIATRLPEAVEVALFYVVSESLTNVAKYARTNAASVTIDAGRGVVRARIHDDGIGGAAAGAGTGLRGLADRVEALDGTLSVDSPDAGGTTVVAEIPVGS